MEKTLIPWCDSTNNPWSGCSKVSPGCTNCYAEARDRRRMIEKVSHWGKGAPRLKHKGAVEQALAMNRIPWICDACGTGRAESFEAGGYCQHRDGDGVMCHTGKFHRRRIFSLSLGDWLDAEVPIEWLAEFLDTVRQCDQVIWILCTKRPESWRARMIEVLKHNENSGGSPVLHSWVLDWVAEQPPRNVVLLTSVENQEMADKRIPVLLRIPAACRGLSLEPLLGPVDLVKAGGLWSDMNGVIQAHQGHHDKHLDWLIIGGESGAGARACNVEWIRGLVKQGRSAVVPTFVKQMGANYIHSDGLPYKFMDKKGADPEEWPPSLQVREFPILHF